MTAYPIELTARTTTPDPVPSRADGELARAVRMRAVAWPGGTRHATGYARSYRIERRAPASAGEAGGRRRAGLVAAVALVVGVVLLGIAGYQWLHPTGPQASALGELSGAGRTTWNRPALPALERSAPTRLRVPAIHVATSLVRLRMADGVLEAPKTGGVAGWYRDSPTPGQTGAAVIAGHVDWTDGPAIFYRLGTLRPGNHVYVERADGRTAVFTVHAIRQYAKNSFPSALVYGDAPGPELRLITCGGSFANGHYVDNIVVFAHLSAVR